MSDAPQRDLNAIVAQALEELADNILNGNITYGAHRLHAFAKEIRALPVASIPIFDSTLADAPQGLIKPLRARPRPKPLKGFITVDEFNQLLLLVIEKLGNRTSLNEVKMHGNRARQAVLARQTTAWLMRNVYFLSYPAIGEYFGHDHSTILYAVRSIEKRQAGSRNFAAVLVELREPALAIVPPPHN